MGIDDPEAWLESVDERVLAGWDAYWQLEPWTVGRIEWAQMMSQLDRVAAYVINPNLEKNDRLNGRPVEDFLPADSVAKRRTKRVEPIAKQLSRAVKAMGLSDDNN